MRSAVRRDRDERRTRFRSHWWFPLTVLLVVAFCCWGLLKMDQLIAEKLIWPTAGAQFVEVGPRPTDHSTTGGPMMIVVAGLNRKDGTGVADALMPSLAANHTRVFSLVYGSGINDQDILDKFDALMTQFQPSQVSFFGSSMGGDVVLNLAAHAQSVHDAYWESRLTGTVAVDPSPGAGPGVDPGRTAGGSGAGSASGAGPGPGVDSGSGIGVGSAAGTGVGSVAGTGVGSVAGTGVGSATGTGSATGSRSGAGSAATPVVAPVDLAAAAAATAMRPAGADPIPRAEPVASGAAAGQSGPAVGSPAPAPFPPRLGTIFLDCSPLGAADVRDSSRTQADAITGLTEALHTDGGVAVRLTAEVLAQRDEWSTGEFPSLQVRWRELDFKVDQVWREKIGAPGISTELIKDQYGVIRRTDIDDVVDALVPGTRIVYFLPKNRHDDTTVRVEQVEQTLRELAPAHSLDLRIVEIPDGHHASAESNSQTYRDSIDAINRDGA